MLFKTQTELSGHAPTNTTFDLEKIKPTLVHVQQTVLEPYCGQQLITSLDEAYNSDDDSALTEPLRQLLAYVQPPLAQIAMTRFVPLGEVQIDTRGITTFDGNDRKSADNAQILRLRTELYQMGYSALERLLTFLEDKVADYPLHQSILDARPKSILPNARTFSACYPIFDSYLTYLGLLPSMQQLEEDRIAPVLGPTYATILANDNLDAAHAALRRKAQRALAYLTVADAISISMAVELDSNGLRLNYTGQIGNVKYYQPPSEETRQRVLSAALHKANGLFDQMAAQLAEINGTPAQSGAGVMDNTGSKIVFW